AASTTNWSACIRSRTSASPTAAFLRAECGSRRISISTFLPQALQPETFAMTIDQLIFVGLRGYALALDRETGGIVWFNSEMKSGYVTLLLDGDRLIVSTSGYIYCLDPLTGQILWNNPLTGYGQGPTSLLSVRGQSSQTLIQQAADDIARSSEASS